MPSPGPGPHEPTLYLWTCLFSTSHINGTMHCGFSRSPCFQGSPRVVGKLGAGLSSASPGHLASKPRAVGDRAPASGIRLSQSSRQLAEGQPRLPGREAGGCHHHRQEDGGLVGRSGTAQAPGTGLGVPLRGEGPRLLEEPHRQQDSRPHLGLDRR